MTTNADFYDPAFDDSAEYPVVKTFTELDDLVVHAVDSMDFDGRLYVRNTNGALRDVTDLVLLEWRLEGDPRLLKLDEFLVEEGHSGVFAEGLYALEDRCEDLLEEFFMTDDQIEQLREGATYEELAFGSGDMAGNLVAVLADDDYVALVDSDEQEAEDD